MSNKRLKIENLENLQELNAEEFSSIQGGYYESLTPKDVVINFDGLLSIDFEIDYTEYNSETGDIALTITRGIVETGSIGNGKTVTVIGPDGIPEAPEPLYMICPGLVECPASLIGGVY